MPFLGKFSFAGPPVQDYVMLGGKQTPGVCNIVKAGTPRTWDIRQGFAFSGAFVVYGGAGLAKFDLIITLWEDEHWSDWDDFASVLEEPAKPSAEQIARALAAGFFPATLKPSALAISHPILTVRPLNIQSVVVENVSQPVQSEFGDWDITISLIQFRAPSPVVLGKPDQTPPKAVNAPPTAKTKADELELKLLEEFARVAS
jgi:hypothetical protein